MGYRHQFTGRTQGIRPTAPLRWRGLDGGLGAFWQAEGDSGGRGYYLSANPRISVFFNDVSSVRVGESERALARRGRPMARAFYVPAGTPMWTAFTAPLAFSHLDVHLDAAKLLDVLGRAMGRTAAREAMARPAEVREAAEVEGLARLLAAEVTEPRRHDVYAESLAISLATAVLDLGEPGGGRGRALGLSGAVMQGVTRNPLADPGILGVNAGAALAVVIGVAGFGIESVEAYLWTAILGAAAAAAFVYAVGSLGRGAATPLRLALAGAATSIAASSLVMAIVLPRNDIAGGVRAWQVGGVGGASWEGIAPALPFLLAGFVLSLVSARSLDQLALGEELAAGLGLRVARARAVAALGAVLLCGAATAVCGPIGFVGLAAPHLCRLLVGVEHRWLLPVSALAGAVLLLLADVAGRLIARPGELDVGLVTAFMGAPLFIWIVRRRKVRAL